MIILSLRLSHLYNTMTACFKNVVDAKIFHTCGALNHFLYYYFLLATMAVEALK